MEALLADRLLGAIEAGNLYSETIPLHSIANPFAQDLFQIVLMIDNEEISRIGVWKNDPSGLLCAGTPRVFVDGSTVNVAAGEGMSGSFSFECDFDAEAEEIAQVLRDTLDGEYAAIEIPTSS